MSNRYKHFLSAFSVASTSTSKQTTQFNTSQCSLENRTIDFDDDHALFSDNRSCRSINTNGLLRSRIPQYEKIESRMLNKRHTPFSINNDNRFNSTSSDTMSLRSGYLTDTCFLQLITKYAISKYFQENHCFCFHSTIYRLLKYE
jgi:hypothetical protein